MLVGTKYLAPNNVNVTRTNEERLIIKLKFAWRRQFKSCIIHFKSVSLLIET